MPARGIELNSAATQARRLQLVGRVQGVGFRPFVYRLASDHRVFGWVCNHGGQVEIHAEGSRENLDAFLLALHTDLPPGASIVRSTEENTGSGGFAAFSIRPSNPSASSDIYPPADLSVCSDCILEMHDPSARRFRYPFINCARCGPRYSLLQTMPYDRRNTTMEEFELCAECLREYQNPHDRRHHAQPLACEQCGPSLSWSVGPASVQGNESSLAAAVAALRQDLTVAVRGVGGYHLLCSAGSAAAVEGLRQKKRRPSKPFAVLVPLSGPNGLDFARNIARLSVEEEHALLRPERPIVIARRHPNDLVVESVAPGLNQIGLMLPYSPLLHLLLNEFQGALVATSGNLAGESILTDPTEAEIQLDTVAAGFLHHNRAIARAADDSVVRVIAGCARPIRLGRGSSPLEMALPHRVSKPTLALGALQKNAIALAWGDRIAISPHIGDFTSVSGRDRLLSTITDFESLYGVAAERIVVDAHPGMKVGHLGQYRELPLHRVWHHFAHASAIAGEFVRNLDASESMLCFSWDANGFGQDGTLWGGEALLGGPGNWVRVASFRPFPLLGGEIAGRQTWRSALGLCWDAGLSWSKEAVFSTSLLRAAYGAGINCPRTSAIGRLFDAAAALLGVCTVTSFAAEAAMRLEALCTDRPTLTSAISMPLAPDERGVLLCDWRPLFVAMLDQSRSVAERAQVFHASLALALRDQAMEIRRRSGVCVVGLGGGVFQNRVLTETVEMYLVHEGFEVCLPTRLPVNDAAISYGQIIEVAAEHLSSRVDPERNAAATVT
ncbi:MAG: carbamoyltransferase HypF [Burkholderiaceae bacterium]